MLKIYFATEKCNNYVERDKNIEYDPLHPKKELSSENVNNEEHCTHVEHFTIS